MTTLSEELFLKSWTCSPYKEVPLYLTDALSSFSYHQSLTDTMTYYLFNTHFNIILPLIFTSPNSLPGRSQWPRGLRRRSLAARLLRLWVRIPPGAWIFVCCECCVLSGSLCDGLIIRSEESYRMWRVVVCDQETS